MRGGRWQSDGKGKEWKCKGSNKGWNYLFQHSMTSDFQSVTAFGRQMIARAKELVEQKYCITNGYRYDAKVCPFV